MAGVAARVTGTARVRRIAGGSRGGHFSARELSCAELTTDHISGPVTHVTHDSRLLTTAVTVTV